MGGKGKVKMDVILDGERKWGEGRRGSETGKDESLVSQQLQRELWPPGQKLWHLNRHELFSIEERGVRSLGKLCNFSVFDSKAAVDGWNIPSCYIFRNKNNILQLASHQKKLSARLASIFLETLRGWVRLRVKRSMRFYFFYVCFIFNRFFSFQICSGKNFKEFISCAYQLVQGTLFIAQPLNWTLDPRT